MFPSTFLCWEGGGGGVCYVTSLISVACFVAVRSFWFVLFLVFFLEAFSPSIIGCKYCNWSTSRRGAWPLICFPWHHSTMSVNNISLLWSTRQIWFLLLRYLRVPFEDHSMIWRGVLTEIFIQTCMQAKVNGIISNSLLQYQGMARLQIDGILERVLKCQKETKGWFICD